MMKAMVMALALCLVSGAVSVYVLWPPQEPVPAFEEGILREWAARFGVRVGEDGSPGGSAAAGDAGRTGQREAQRTLGTLSGMEDTVPQRLAQELLGMLRDQPGLERYTVVASQGGTRHSLTADVVGNALIHITSSQGGADKTLQPGQTAIYRGYVRPRLEAAAAGGVLDQTPEGPRPAQSPGF